jgi:CDP-paratose 2-epimerase
MLFLVTGGAGFIGSNTVSRLIEQGHRVIIWDNLSRNGSRKNLAWLTRKFPDLLFENVDIRNSQAVTSALVRAKDVDVILHFAAQVAVTTSMNDPRMDFEVNALGTFNLLEAVRQSGTNPIFLFTSTNKVYGGMESLQIEKVGNRYRYQDLINGVNEETPLDFHSPYGCSKGAADQYVRDYHRIYGLRTVVFRQSCIYGPHQYGLEEQGWIAWFIIAATQRNPIRIYGDGFQVRDILYVDDLVDAYLNTVERIQIAQGQVYNIGGGIGNTISVWSEFGPLLKDLLGFQIPVQYADWRPGDQKVFICDIRKAKIELNWFPKTSVQAGITKLIDWVKKDADLS